MINKRIIYLIFSHLLFVACAQVVMPTGGEKDTVAPKILGIYPTNESTQFNAKKITLEFDEFAKLDKLKQQLIVSPPLKHDLNAKMKGKSLVIEIEDTLKPNTTYVLNFGNSIVDITENNPIQNFQYVFSTGAFLDSLALSGKVLDAFSREVEKEMLVLLYEKKEKNDSLLFTDFPTYVSRTDENGNYKLTNIAAGDYLIFALKETNNNFIYDRPNEKIAFRDEILSLPRVEKEEINLFAFEEASKKQYIETKNWQENELLVKFIKPFNRIEFDFLDTTLNDLLLDYSISPQKDTARFWFKELAAKRYKFIIHLDSNFTDTLRLKFDSISKLRKLKIEDNLDKKLPYYQPLALHFNRLINDFDTSEIALLTVSDSSKIEFNIEIDSVNLKKVHILFKHERDSSYFIQLNPGAFTDIFNKEWKDSLFQKISFDGEKDYGLLELEVDLENDTGAYIIQLTDNKGEVLRSKTLTEFKANFRHLKPGNFRLKLISDRNGNGRWDTGNYGEKMQAEKTFLYDEDIQIRSNWDKKIKWIIKSNL